jgi:hypothetical protein
VKNYTIKPYETQDYPLWNSFIERANNSSFLFHRDFMEYHSDRFVDFSLVVLDDEKWVAVFPANRVGYELHSHQGLTYGGLVFENSINGEIAEAVLQSLFHYLRDCKIQSFQIKLTPWFYFKDPSFEMDYFLFKNQAQLYFRYMNLAIDYSKPLQISKSKLKHFRRISNLDIEIIEEKDCASFWNQILIPRLHEKHQVAPVHNVDEINSLKSKFPNNIRQFNAYFEGEIVAGITLFCSKLVVKSQYGATSEKGEKIRALDFLFINLIHQFADEVRFFDMGTVNDNSKNGYNKGLLKQKEELGCKIVVQDCYKINLG